ncbi:MAG: hypothetical protein H6650_04470 [Ardenticatenales bacterium]|nr:hypothetical protein [Ardenticatenales bacterium]
MNHMRHRLPVVLRMFLLLCAVVVLGRAAPAAQAQEGNLLRNPSFEGNYSAWLPQYGTAQMAADWTPWWVEDGGRDPIWAQPEYKPAERAIYPRRVLDGERAQQYFTFFKSHYAGMYQQVFNVTPGTTYRFTVWVQVWSSIDDDASRSNTPANPRLHIGIDPTGAAWPGFVGGAPATVVWSGEAPMDCIIDQWCPLSIDVTAQNSTITVYMRSSPDFANKHNDLYFDNASLVAIGPPPPPTLPPTRTPDPNAPTATSIPPTATPVPPTETPVPPTETPVPPTETPIPPTETPIPPTETPIPPTETPIPPTATAVPPTEDTAPATAVAVVAPSPTPLTIVVAENAGTNDNTLTITILALGGLTLLAAGAAIGYLVRGGRR